MRLTLVAAAFLITGLIAAPIAVEAQSSYSVSGFVCAGYAAEESCDRTPLEGASVHVISGGIAMGLGASDDEGTSDKDGFFQIDGIASGSYTLTISRAGFEDFSQPLEVNGDSMGSYALSGAELQQTGLVSSDKGPVSNANVYFYGDYNDDFADAITGDDGRFETTLTGGYYQVNVEHKEYQSGYNYFLLDGSEVTIDVDSVPGRDVALSGKITDQAGAPVAGAQVNVDQCCQNYGYPEPVHYDEGTASSPAYYYGGYQSTETAADGTYTLNIYEGWYNINVYKDGYANVWADGEATGTSVTEDMVIEKFPDKSAVIHGKIVDKAGKGLGSVSVSISNEKYGQYECSTYEENYEPEYEWGCKILLNSDGTFEAKVMPGYSIISVYYDHWRTCDTSQNGDGSSSTSCGADYYRASKVIDLQADSEQDVTIRLQQRPGPDAVVQGYVLNEEGKGISEGQINFNRVDGYGYAWADMNEHGSYSLSLRSGYYSVQVYADGYFRWEGNLQIAADGTTDFDVTLTAGQSQYGGYCCYAYGGEIAYATEDSRDGSGPKAVSASGPSQGEDSASVGSPGGSGSEDDGFENLGGLGAYDKASREKQLQASSETPGFGILIAAVGLLGLSWARRQR